MMNEHRKSDRPVVPAKPSNKADAPLTSAGVKGPSAAEEAEGRGLAKGNSLRQNALRTPNREGAPSAWERIRQAARINPLRRMGVIT
jgi:hypothetical protein